MSFCHLSFVICHCRRKSTLRKHVDTEDKTTVAICDTGSSAQRNRPFCVLVQVHSGTDPTVHLKEIQVFKNELFGEIRTLTGERGEPLFVGKDVATALGYSKSRNALAAHVDEEDKTTALIQGPGSLVLTTSRRQCSSTSAQRNRPYCALKEPTLLLKPILLRQKWGGNAPFVVSARFCRNVYVKKVGWGDGGSAENEYLCSRKE